jgi:hypothetical protein
MENRLLVEEKEYERRDKLRLSKLPKTTIGKVGNIYYTTTTLYNGRVIKNTFRSKSAMRKWLLQHKY